MSDSTDLPRGWVKTTLAEILAPLHDGRTLHHGWSPQCATEPSPSDDEWGVLKTTAVQDGEFLPQHNKRLPSSLKPRAQFEVMEGDILITCAGPRERCGVPCFVRQTRPKLILSGKMYRFRACDAVDPRYLEAFLRSKDTQAAIDRMKTGISDSGLNLTHGRFLPLPVLIAPLNEQRRIVEKIEELFSDLEAGVAALTRARANLKRYRASVLKAAVQGALTAEWRTLRPQVEPASKLLERILTERRRQWEADQLAKFAAAGKQPPNNWQAKYAEPAPPDTTNLPTLPDCWCWTKLDQLLVHLRNGYFQSPSGADHGTPILRINAVRPLRVDLSETRFLDKIEGDVGGYFIEDGDLLFTRYNGSVDLLGVAGMVRGCATRILHPDKLIRVKLAIREPLSAFVEIAANIGASRQHMAGRARTTAGQTGISGTDVREMPIPLPPLAEQAEIVATVSEKLSQIESAEVSIEHSLRRAARLRQSILKQAFEGKLVPQDPTDEPASTLLERIKAGNDAKLKTTNVADRTRTRRGSTSKRFREDEP